MEKPLDKIRAILTKSETELQQLIADAARAGDYLGVDLARNAAVGIQGLQERVANPGLKLGANSGAEKAVGRGKRGHKGRSKARYPKFAVEEDTLVRIGWSKKQRQEYAHKAPKLVFERTVEAMAVLARSAAGPFTAEKIIEQLNTMEGQVVASYQAYVVIGFLRKTGCVEQVGRMGYTIPASIAQEAQRAWNDRVQRPGKAVHTAKVGG